MKYSEILGTQEAQDWLGSAPREFLEKALVDQYDSIRALSEKNAAMESKLDKVRKDARAMGQSLGYKSELLTQVRGEKRELEQKILTLYKEAPQLDIKQQKTYEAAIDLWKERVGVLEDNIRSYRRDLSGKLLDYHHSFGDINDDRYYGIEEALCVLKEEFPEILGAGEANESSLEES